MYDYKGFSPEKIQHEAVDKVVKLAKVLGSKSFDSITQDKVNNLINAHAEPLTNKDLLELTKSNSKEEVEATDPEQEEEEGLTLEYLSEFMRSAKELQEKAEAWDPYTVRSLQFKNAVDAAMQT